MMSLKIKKRNGEDVSFNPQKIYNRVKRAAKGLNVNSDEIFIKVITSVPTEGLITTKELDKLVYEIAAAYTGSHHDYSRLASSVAISSYHKETNPRYYNLLKKFKELTGCPILINTSFNVRGEPIVCSIEDAFNCFMGTDLDILVCENYVMYKNQQNNKLIQDYKNKFEDD